MRRLVLLCNFSSPEFSAAQGAHVEVEDQLAQQLLASGAAKSVDATVSEAAKPEQSSPVELIDLDFAGRKKGQGRKK